MKIAHIVLKTFPYGGGIEKYIEEIGPRLTGMGHEIVVYTMRNYGIPPTSYKGMTIKPVPTWGSKSAEKITSSFMATLDVCLKEKPDIVHYHAFNHQITFVPKWFGIPVLVQGHGIEWKRSRWNFLGKWVLKASEQIMVHSADRLTVVSKVQQTYLKEKYGKNCDYIPTGINPPRNLPPNLITKKWGLNGRDYFLTAVRLVPEKGIHYLIEAFNGLKTDFKLVIAGDASQEKNYGDELRKMTASNPNIIFTGYVSGDVFSELMSNPYAFVLASELEGLPIALLEAMSYCNCCIVSDIPENLEALRDKGLTFKSKSPDDLNARLQQVIENPGLAEKYRGISSEDLFGNHSWDTIARQFDALYRELAHKRKKT